jgi:hypothetical protein
MRILLTILLFSTAQLLNAQQLFHAHNRVAAAPGGCTPVTYDSDAQAFFTRAAAEGLAFSDCEKVAHNNFVLAAKSAGYYSQLVAFYPFLGSSASVGKLNAISSSYNLTFINGATIDSWGWNPNGVDQYAQTGIVPSSVLLQNSTHLMAYVNNSISSGGFLMGVDGGGGPILRMLPNEGGSIYAEINSSGAVSGTQLSMASMIVTSRVNGTSFQVYRDGALHSDNAVAAWGLPAYELYLSQNNRAGSTIGGYYSARRLGAVSVGFGLTATQVAQYKIDLEAYMDALGRGVL